MTKDLTIGKPWKVMLQFGLPLFLGNLFQLFYNIVDTIMIGNALGMSSLAAVGSTGPISFFVVGFCTGFGTGFTMPAAQAFGAKDEKRLKHIVGLTIIWGTAIAAVVTLLSCLACRLILTLMQTPEDIFHDAYVYIITIFAGIFASMLYNISAGILRALGDSKTPLVLLIISSLLNILFNYISLYILNMGVFGPAISTVLSQTISGVICVIFMALRFPILHIHKEDFEIDWQLSRTMFGIGIPMALLSSITAIGTMIIQGSVNALGTVYIGANTVATKAMNLAMTLVNAIGAVMATYTAQNFGAGKYERIRQGMKQSYIMMGIGVAVSMLYGVFLGRWVMTLFSSDITVEELDVGMIYIYIHCASFVFFGLLCIFRNVLTGLGLSVAPMLGGVAELVGRLIAVALNAILVSRVSSDASFAIITLSSTFAWIGADAIMILRYIQFNSRLKKKTEEMEAHPETKHILNISEL